MVQSWFKHTVIVNVHLVKHTSDNKSSSMTQSTWYVTEPILSNMSWWGHGTDCSGVSEHIPPTVTALGARAEEWDNAGDATQHLNSKITWLRHNLLEDTQVKSCCPIQLWQLAGQCRAAAGTLSSYWETHAFTQALAHTNSIQWATHFQTEVRTFICITLTVF